MYMLTGIPYCEHKTLASTAHLLVVAAGHVLLHTLPHGLVLAGGAADHPAAHPTLQQHVQALWRCSLTVRDGS